MSNNNSFRDDSTVRPVPTDNEAFGISNDTTAVSSASMWNTRSTSEQNEVTTSTTQSSHYLDIPSRHPSFRRPSRASLDSTYTDLSELSFASADIQHSQPLIRSDSQDEEDGSGSSSRRPFSKNSLRSRVTNSLRPIYVTNYGALLVLCAQFFGALMNLSTRLLESDGAHGKGMHPFQILFARQSITSLTCTIWALYTRSIPDFPLGPSRPRSIRLLLLTRGFSGFFGVFGMYFSLLYLPLSEATVMTFLAPIMTCYLCSYVLPEQGRFGRGAQLAGGVSLVGVVFIARPRTSFASSGGGGSGTGAGATPAIEPGLGPPNSTLSSSSSTELSEVTSSQHLLAIAIAMLGVLGATGAMTAIRAIGNRAHPFLSINYFSVFCTVMSLVCLLVFEDVEFRLPGNWVEWGLLASLGACGFVMQWLLTRGLAYGSGDANGEDDEGIEQKVEEGIERKKRGKKRNREEVQGEGEGVGDADGDIELALIHSPECSSAPNNKLPTNTSARNPKEPKIKGSSTRATSMVYTQMLFALAGDKIVFGVTPDTMSWIGSVLILAGAVWVAASRSEGEGKDDGEGRGKRSAREEEGIERALAGVVDDPVEGPCGQDLLEIDRSKRAEEGEREEMNQETVALMSAGGDNVDEYRRER